MTVFVGTAGWGLSREQQALFGPGGSLQNATPPG